MTNLLYKRIQKVSEISGRSNYCNVIIKDRRFIVGFHEMADLYSMPFHNEPTDNAKELLGNVLDNNIIALWVYTHISGKVAVIKIPDNEDVIKLALSLKEVCHEPMTPTEASFFLELSSGGL